MPFPVDRVSGISYSIGWEVSLVGRNTITHGGSVGPVTLEDDERLIECTGPGNCSIVRCSILNRKSGVDLLLGSLTNFEYLA